MLALYRQLFNSLHESQVEYCIWKNVQEVPEALAGTGDLDLYISPDSHASFVTALRMQGFTRVISHKATPCVEHYYGYDEPSQIFCHLHCYFRIVTGESHIKQYVVPIEDYLSVLPSQQNDSGVSEMHPALQYKLNLFRRAVKLSCLPGALLYFRERRGYQEERFLLEQALRTVTEIDGKSIDIGWLASIQPPVSLPGEILAGMRYRILFRHWSRFPAFATPVYRYGTILLRFAGKLRRRRKMLPMGITITVAGPSRNVEKKMENQLAEWLGDHFDVASVDDVESLRWPEKANPANIESECSQSPGNAASVLWRSFKRYRKVNSALRHAMTGSIVIWRGQNPETIRRTVETASHSKNDAQSTLASSLLRASNALLRAGPGIDILLQMNATSFTDAGENDLSTAYHADFQPDLTAPSVSGRYPRVISTCGNTWKLEVWHALVALQP